MASIWTTLLVISLALAAGILLLFIYRVLFHPLAGIPGPLSMKMSGWTHFNIVRTGKRAYVLEELHKTYGPVVRLAPNLVSINSASALNDIYGDRKAPVVKSDWYEGPAAPEKGYSSFTMRDEAMHAPRRRLLNHAFSEKTLRDSEAFVSSNINSWLDRLGDREQRSSLWTEPKNVYRWIRYLTFDILTDLCFGRSFDLLNKTDMRFCEGLIPDMTQMANELGFHPLRPIVSFLLFSTPLGGILGGKIVKGAFRLMSTSRSLLKERRDLELSGGSSGAHTRRDFFHYLFRGTDPDTGKSLTNEELFAESANLMVAGADTTSTTLAAAIFYLLRNPTKLVTLRKELDENFSSLAEIDYYGTVLGRLPYLRGVIMESLRSTPPVGGALSREVVGEGITVDGKFYPPKTEVCVPLYALSHNAEYYPDPYNFIPERWIVDEKTGYTKEMVDRAQAAFCTFSIGQRGCVGKNLAYIELHLAIARLVCRFDMEEVPGWERSLRQESDRVKDFDLVSPQGEYRGRDIFIIASDGPLVRFRERQK